MVAYPALEPLAFVPTGMVPDDDDHTFCLLTGSVQQSLHKGPCLFTVRLTLAEVEIDLVGTLSHRSKAGQSFLFLMAIRFTLGQTKWLLVDTPGAGGGLGKARKPALILIEQQPVLVGRCLSLQPVASFFFAA